MGIRRHVPNAITLLNLFSGSIAVIFAVKGQLELTAICVMLGIFFDFFDGLAARLLKVQSELGLQLDSLADMVTSGVAPGIVMFQLLNRSVDKNDWRATELQSFYARTLGREGIIGDSNVFDFMVLPSGYALLGLLIILASAYRLAKFNIDTRQTTSFIGLPTPANTLLIVSLPLILFFGPPEWVEAIILNKWFLISLTFLSCYLLNAEIPLFALKFKTWDFGANKLRYIFLIITLVLLLVFKFLAVPCVILMYVLLSLIFRKQTI